MRLLLDENVGIKRWADFLTQYGHDVERVVDVDLQGANDEAVIAYACEKDRALVSRDKALEGPGDLRSAWAAQPSPKPLLLLIYPGEVVTVADIGKAIANLEGQGIVADEICVINAWRY